MDHTLEFHPEHYPVTKNRCLRKKGKHIIFPSANSHGSFSINNMREKILIVLTSLYLKFLSFICAIVF